MKESQPQAIRLKDYRAPDFLIDETHLRFELFEEGARVTSRLKMRRNPESKPFRNLLELDGQDLQLEHLVLDGKELEESEYRLTTEKLVLERLPAKFELQVVTWILPQENTCLEGLYRSHKMFCTQCEAEGFRRITYYLDRPDVMSKFTTTIEADKKAFPVLLSNGNPTDSGDLGPRHWATWEDPFKKPCYLFALVAGDLEFVESHYRTMSGRNVQLRIYLEPQDLEKCDHAMQSLKKSMAWDEQVYGREYDLDIFNIVAVSDFNMGAMENKGLNIFNSSCVLANSLTATDNAFQRVEAIVAHEYFHNWSGNRVTCRDWFQLSLKEGFTVFRDAEFSADMHSRAVKRIEDATVMRTAQFAEDAGPMSHPVRPETYIEISNFYTLTVYEKGAEVVRMLHTLLGADKFREGSDLYFARHDGQAVTTEDFVKCMEDVSGRDLSQFRRWYSQAGTPRLEITDTYDAERQEYRLEFKQSCPETPGQSTKLPFVIPIRLGLLAADGRSLAFQTDEHSSTTESVLELTEKTQTFAFGGVTEKPVPSLLRGFSAPVKADFPYTREQLCFLMAHDKDGFNRWDAGQQLALNVIDDLVEAMRDGRQVAVDPLYLSAFASVVEDTGDDYSMLAKMMVVPSLSLLAERAELIDIDALVQARELLINQLDEATESQLLTRYHRLGKLLQDSGLDLSSSKAMGIRAMRNGCLQLLAQAGNKKVVELAQLQVRQVANMTDELGATQALVQCGDESAASQAVEAFHDKWRQDSLVMDNWFSIQAGCASYGNLDRVKRLTRHSLFSERNPNKVRAVLGSFAGQNWKQFHQADGSGYLFLEEWVVKLDNINPQVAARLVIPLTRWKKFLGDRKELMRQALQRIHKRPNLSKDLYEVVMKSL